MNSFVVCFALVLGSTQAGPTQIQPVPETSVSQSDLFKCVKYRQLRNVAPYAVPVVVQVPDPCRCSYDKSPCKCGDNCKCNCECKCACKTVNVQICVPKTCCDVKPCVTQRGNRTRFDYGKYAVNVYSVAGRLVVDYDD